MSPETDAYIEYRVCGIDNKAWPWEGPWRRGEPTSREMYDIEQLAKRNERVWVERRRVGITDLGRRDVTE